MGAGALEQHPQGQSPDHALRNLTRLGIVTGLAAEARCLSRAARRSPTLIHIVNASGDPTVAAQSLAAMGVGSLMSFGIAGGLDPALAPGRVIVATAVIDCQGERFDCHAAWRDGLIAALGHLSPVAAPLVGSESPLVALADKRAFHALYGAAAVDMESHAVARVAARAGLPFAAIRAIADPAGRALPSAALAGLSDRGAVRAGQVLRELARHPRQLPDLVRAALDTRKALDALGRCADADDLLFCGG